MKTADIEVTLLDSMGDDLTVVNAARVSFDKASEWDYSDELSFDGHGPYQPKVLSDKDAKLIRYLVKNPSGDLHWAPFAHVQLQFRIKAPIFVARQLAKHQVGLVWNEVSRRYVDSEPEVWMPENLRAKADDKKQGSSDEIAVHFVDSVEAKVYTEDGYWNCAFSDIIEGTFNLYLELLKKGVAPEQARMVLPLNSMTEWWWTGSLAAFARVCKLRLDPHAQEETRQVAVLINEECSKVAPISWKELMNGYC